MVEKVAVPMKDPTTYLPYDICIDLERSAKGLRNKLLVSLMWRCGLRVEEVITIRKKDIYIDKTDLENSVLVVLGKGKKYRRVPVDTRICGALYKYASRFNDEDFIFPSYSKRGHLTKQWVRRLLIKIGKRIGVTEDVGGHSIHPHTLRHSFAIFLIQMGVPVMKVQQILGHSSLSSTTYYLQFSKEELAKDYHDAFKKMRESEKI